MKGFCAAVVPCQKHALTQSARQLQIVTVAQAVAPAGRGSHFSSITSAIFGFSLALCAGFACCSLAAKAAAIESAKLTVWTGGSKPAFVLDDLDKTKVSFGPPALETSSHEVVIVHFFATWCEPCREELPALRRLAERTDSRRLRVLTISVGEVDARVRNFADKFPMNFPILLDRDRTVARAWNVSGLPTTFVLDRDLRPRLFIERDYDWDQFDVPDFLKSLGSAKQSDAQTTRSVPTFDTTTTITTTGGKP